MWINKEYNNPPVIVTENGVSDNNGVKDTDRINYLNSYLSAILDAMVNLFYTFEIRNRFLTEFDDFFRRMVAKLLVTLHGV